MTNDIDIHRTPNRLATSTAVTRVTASIDPFENLSPTIQADIIQKAKR